MVVGILAGIDSGWKIQPQEKEIVRARNISLDVGMQGDANNTLIGEIVTTTDTTLDVDKNK
jgi:hypothetical protein